MSGGKYKYPNGYSFFETYRRAIEVVSNPLESILYSVDRFGETYSVHSGLSKRMILTQDLDLAEYILKKNHKNYNKSEMVSRNLARFLGKGLLTSNGAYWLKQRRLIQPGFHAQKIHALYSIMQKTTDKFLDAFPEGKSVDILPLMNHFAFDVVINTLFDVKIPQGEMDELSRFITETQEFVVRDIRKPHKRWWHRLSGEVSRHKRNSVRAREILRSIIAERRAGEKKFNDLLDMLLDARYEDSGEPMSEEQILDEILILIIAGHETTANALTWTLHLLASHPEELQKLRTATQGMPLESIVTDKRIHAVIQESMRLYPPAWASDRVAMEDDSFKDYSFPKGTVIVIFYYGLHRDKRYWPQPDEFRPDRFLSGDKESLKAYFPFGGGPRLCIGNNFAMAEMALLLHAFIHKFDFHRTDAEPSIKPLITLRPVNVRLDTVKKC